MAEEDCRPQVQACRMRVSRLDPNGVPSPGAENLYVTDALVELVATPVVTDGDEIEEKTACGTVAVNYKGPDTLKRYDVTITLVTPDPWLSAWFSGGDVLTVADVPKGYAAPPLGPITGSGVSVELLVNRIDDGDLDADFPYAWWAYPKVKNLRPAAHTHNSGAIKPQFVGQALENPNWFDGPLNDWPATSDRVFQWIPTNQLWTPSCGPVALAAS